MDDTVPRWIGSPPAERPQVLFAGLAEPLRGLFSKVLEAEFTLTHVTTGRSVLEQATDLRPDLILLDAALADMPAASVCHALLTEHRISTTTPVLFVTPAAPTLEQRLVLVRAGARDCIGMWIAPEDAGRLCRAFVQAKQDADQGTAESLYDPATGLYSWQGLVRRARELGALAVRQRQGLACLVFAVDVPQDAEARHTAAAVRSARDVQKTVRLSDAVGRPGNAEFAVLAPATDSGGAVGLAIRLAVPARAAAAREIGLDPDAIAVRAGYSAVANLAYRPMDPATLLLRAGTALHAGEPDPSHQWLRRFIEQPRV